MAVIERTEEFDKELDRFSEKLARMESSEEIKAQLLDFLREYRLSKPPHGAGGV